MPAIEIRAQVLRDDPKRADIIAEFKTLGRYVELLHTVAADEQTNRMNPGTRFYSRKILPRLIFQAISNLDAEGFGSIALQVRENKARLLQERDRAEILALEARVLGRANT